MYNDDAINPVYGIKESELEKLLSAENAPRVIEKMKCTLYTTGETVKFKERREDRFEMTGRHPACTEVPNLVNACGPIAAANIIQYYSRFMPDLIEDYVPGKPCGDMYVYYEMCPKMEDVVAELYEDMHTNNPRPGTTVEQFVHGMHKFCKAHGHRVEFVPCMRGGAFDFADAKRKISAGIPLVIFLAEFCVADFMKDKRSDFIKYMNGNGGHVLAGFGYDDVEYLFRDGDSRRNKYIAVATGMGERKRGYCNIDSVSDIDCAYSVKIS